MDATATASTIRYAPEDPDLPKPWIGLVDDSTGYFYFWNPETNVTQYEIPVSSSPPKLAAIPVSSSVQTQQSSSGFNSGKEEDKYSRGTDGPKSDSGSRFSEAGRTGPIYSNDTSSGLGNAASSGSSARGPPSSATGNELSPEAYCRRHEITVSGGQVPPPLMSFEATGLPPELLREVKSAGFSAPSPIQAQSWPIAMQNRDIVAIAKTGSGKTLGYLIPGFMHLQRKHNDSRMGPTILVLSPTRELATQIQVEALKFGKSSKISCACLYGGAPRGPQLKEIERGVDIVVATPGRLNDILQARRISLRQVSYLVLDEADRMLDMGFEPQIREIVNEVPTKHQTLMYTATWPKEVRKIAADLLVNPAQVNIGNVDELVANKSITQDFGMAATATASTIRYAPEDPNLPKPWKDKMPEADVAMAELPPDIRTLLDRTAHLVSKRGLEMEKRIMRLMEDDKDRRFNFLRSSDPLHALYQHKLSEYRALKTDGPAQDIQPDDPAQGIQPDAPATHECIRVRRAPPLRLLPHSFEVPKPPQGITLKEIGIIMLTAQFVARYGMYFLVDLMKEVKMNPQFEFMKETDSRCGYFTQLVVAYNSRVLLPSEQLSERRACNETLLKDFFDHLQLEKLEEGGEMALSDLLAFVGGVDYFARIKYEESIATPPEYFSMLLNPPPQMQPGIPVTPPLGPKSSSGQIISNQAQADVTIIEPHPEIRKIVERTALLVSQEGLEIERRIRDCNVGNRKFNFLWSSDPGHAFYQHKLAAYSAGKQDGPAQDMYIKPTLLVSICDTPIYPIIKPPEGVTLKEIGIMKLTAQFTARYGIDFMVELQKRLEASVSVSVRHHFGFIDESDARCEYFNEVAVAYTGVLRCTEKLRERGPCKETVLEGFFKLLQLEKQEEVRDVLAFVGGVDYFALKEGEGMEEEGSFTGTDDEGSSTGTDDEGSSTGTDDEGSSSMTTNQSRKRQKLDGFASGNVFFHS